MRLEEFEREQFVRRYEYDDATVVVADLGPVAGEATVDVVDGTAVVVVEDGDGATQTEVDVPARDAQAFIRNGVLTIEVSEQS